MSRLKLVLLAAIVVILGIIFVQNREPLALKLLCPDSTQACLYQTPRMPLAIWMGIFALGGFISSLLGQILNRYRYSGTKRYSTGNLDPETQWSTNSSNSSRGGTSTKNTEDSAIADKYKSSSYEAPQKPESVERSGSTYSYRYRDARDKPQDSSKSSSSYDRSSTSSSNTSIDSDIDLSKDDEDWI